MRLSLSVAALALFVSACASSSPAAEDAASGSDGPTQAADSAIAESFDYGAVDYDEPSAGSALRGDRGNSEFPPPVVDPRDIVSGGPPPDGIPPIDDPRFVSIADADFITDSDEGVVAVEINGEARAYPIQVLIWHEIVNDVVGGVPVTVTFCPLCNSAVVYERQFGDRLLDFGTSGELYQSALVMYDRQTESLWAHFTGQAIVGHYAGAQLQLVPAQTVSFAAFAEAFPEGRVLDLDTGFSRPYGTNPYVGYDDETTRPIGGFISQPIDDAFSEKTRLVGVTDDLGSFSILLEDLAAVGVVAVSEGGRNVVVFHIEGLSSAIEAEGIADGRDVGQTGVFVAEAADGTALTFTAGDRFVDDQTGSTWDVFGRAVDGPLSGEALAGVPHVDSFWFSWSTYRPDQVVITP